LSTSLLLVVVGVEDSREVAVGQVDLEQAQD
jgi:hypothetical protein